MPKAATEPFPKAGDPAMHARRDAWIKRVGALVDQVEGWSKSLNWPVERTEETIEEPLLGSYIVPGARIRLPGPAGQPERAVLVTPIALHIVAGDGRVDLEGYPTLSRVKLIGVDGGWTIMTDSNVPLRRPWDRETFRQLAQDLIA